MSDKKVIDIVPPAFAGASAGKPVIKETEKEEVRPLRNLNFPKKILIAPFLLGLGAVAFFTLGEAKIEIWPDLQPLALDLKIKVDKTAKSLDLSQKVIPGFVFETATTVSREFATQGRKLLETKAEGLIRVYNNSSLEQVLIQNTRFQAPLEKFEPRLEQGENPWFKSRERITIPAKGFKDVKAVADSSGEKYNIKPSKFSVPGLAGSAQYTLITGESFQQFTGGQKKEIAQVSAKDLEGAKETLIKEAKEQGSKSLQEIVPQSHIVLPDSLKTEITDDANLTKAGAESEKFTYRISVGLAALTFKKEDLDSVIDDFIISQVPEGKKMDQENLKLDYSVFSIDRDFNKMVLSVGLGTRIYPLLDEILLKKGLLGRSLREAKLFLETQEGVEKIKIKLWPFWLRGIPDDIKRIKLETIID